MQRNRPGLRVPLLTAGVLTLAIGAYAAFRLTNARVDAAIAEADAAAWAIAA